MLNEGIRNVSKVNRLGKGGVIRGWVWLLFNTIKVMFLTGICIYNRLSKGKSPQAEYMPKCIVSFNKELQQCTSMKTIPNEEELVQMCYFSCYSPTMSNKVLCLWVRHFLSSARIHETCDRQTFKLTNQINVQTLSTSWERGIQINCCMVYVNKNRSKWNVQW